jgi:sialic acid synthase SpsE
MASRPAVSLAAYAAWESPALIVAEAGVNHEGDLETARRMVHAVAEAGAGAIKFQVYKADRLATRASSAYWDRSQEATESQFALFSKYDRFGEDDYRALADECVAAGVAFSVSPFDVESVAWLDSFVDLFKIASGDITNLPLLARVAATAKPVLLSTGASTLEEIALALAHLRRHGANEIALLQCTLAYPTPTDQAGVGALKELAAVFPDEVLGYSDHTVPPASFGVIAAAYALGARVVETHFTLDRSLPGNDHYHALDPDDLRRLVDELDTLRGVLGPPVKRVLDVELPARTGARRSVVARVAIAAGTPLTPDLLDVKRPGGGVPPAFLDETHGWHAVTDIAEDTTLEWDMLARDGS